MKGKLLKSLFRQTGKTSSFRVTAFVAESHSEQEVEIDDEKEIHLVLMKTSAGIDVENQGQTDMIAAYVYASSPDAAKERAREFVSALITQQNSSSVIEQAWSNLARSQDITKLRSYLIAE